MLHLGWCCVLAPWRRMVGTCLGSEPRTEQGPRDRSGRGQYSPVGRRVRDKGFFCQELQERLWFAGKRVWKLREGSVERFFDGDQV